jgi:AraC family transcriptional regulator, exoenzyme S synthesis regulatory protein ExsA
MTLNLYEVLKNFPNLSKQLTCKDLMFTQYDCPQATKTQEFFLQTNLIVYVLSGRRVFVKNRKRWELAEGTCAFVRKGTHIAEMEEGVGWCVMTFFIPDDFFKRLISDNLKNLPLANLPEAGTDHVLRLEVNELSKSFFASMLPYFTQTLPPPENLLELKFKELTLSLLSQKQNRQLLAYLHNLYQDKHPTMEEIVQNNFTFNLTLEDYAKLACKSVPTFKREFKKIFNDSPAKWVMKKRINLAIELLENTKLSISEITLECGFENQTHFSRIFKEKVGTSPLRFRMHPQNTSPQ